MCCRLSTENWKYLLNVWKAVTKRDPVHRRAEHYDNSRNSPVILTMKFVRDARFTSAGKLNANLANVLCSERF